MAGDPAASEQVTHDMRSSVPLRAVWRVVYTVDGGPEQRSDWTAIGEMQSVPAGAKYVRPEFDGEVISGGPWLGIGGGPRT